MFIKKKIQIVFLREEGKNNKNIKNDLFFSKIYCNCCTVCQSQIEWIHA